MRCGAARVVAHGPTAGQMQKSGAEVPASEKKQARILGAKIVHWPAAPPVSGVPPLPGRAQGRRGGQNSFRSNFTDRQGWAAAAASRPAKTLQMHVTPLGAEAPRPSHQTQPTHVHPSPTQVPVEKVKLPWCAFIHGATGARLRGAARWQAPPAAGPRPEVVYALRTILPWVT